MGDGRAPTTPSLDPPHRPYILLLPRHHNGRSLPGYSRWACGGSDVRSGGRGIVRERGGGVGGKTWGHAITGAWSVCQEEGEL